MICVIEITETLLIGNNKSGDLYGFSRDSEDDSAVSWVRSIIVAKI